MNSQENRKVKASSARTTRFMPARKAGKNGSTRCGAALVAAIAEAIEAGRRAAEIDHRRKNAESASRRKCAPMPGQAERQDQARGRRAGDQCARAATSATRRSPGSRRRPDRVASRRCAMATARPRWRAAAATQHEDQRRAPSRPGALSASGAGAVRRRAGPSARTAVSLQPHAAPPARLTAPSPISSIAGGLERADQLHQRIDIAADTPSLASMRWMVGTDRPASSASLRWSMPSSARAARSCAAVITSEPSDVRSDPSVLSSSRQTARISTVHRV